MTNSKSSAHVGSFKFYCILQLTPLSFFSYTKRQEYTPPEEPKRAQLFLEGELVSRFDFGFSGFEFAIGLLKRESGVSN